MKYLNKDKKRKWPIILAVAGFAAVFGFLGWIILGGADKPQDLPDVPGTSSAATQDSAGQLDGTQPAASGETTETAPRALSLPYELSDGKLTVDAILQFTGMNPDRQDEWADNVAAIQITNTSGEHLAFATINVTTMDGITASFTAYDIPAGRSAMVMCPDNTVIENNPECAQITGDAVFLPQSPLAEDKLLVSVEGTDITLENISGEDLGQITVYCHSMLDDSCYGGMVLPYKIDSLPAGETAEISAWECILGLVEVVRIEIGAE